MKKLIYFKFIALTALFFLVSGCDFIKNIFSNKSSDNSSQAALSKLILIDVNEENIYNDAHIKGSLHIPYSKIDDLENISKDWNKNSKVVVYCTNYQCLASKEFAQKLKDFGFTDVSVFTGGVAQWYQLSQADKNYEIDGKFEEKYLKNKLEPVAPEDKNISVITAQELLKLIQDSGITKK